METENTCVVCGGTDFYKEAGFYYCTECQTQTQGVQEAVFDVQPPQQFNANAGPAPAKRRLQPKKKVERRLTTWECYNYILLGLVNELIAIGAKKELKNVVKCLWFKYLEKCEIVPKTQLGLPKLSALYATKDAEIIYGRTPNKKRNRSLSPSSSDTTPSAHTKRSSKKSFHELEYSKHQEQTQDSVGTHVSLQSLKGSTDTHTKTNRLLFSKVGREEFLKVCSRRHYTAHRNNDNSDLRCHKFTYKTVSRQYKYSPSILSRSKVFGIIYLGLVMIKDKIQLGDMLRFIREGHLSYNNVEHFFPEEVVALQKFDVGSYNARSMPLTHSGLRSIAASLATYLEVTKLIHVQNLVELCERYCKELNLPEQVAVSAVKLISRAPPIMTFYTTSKEIPNYEARAISFIIFTIKLLFGLDEETEHELSRCAKIINLKAKMSNLQLPQMFVWSDWIKFIEYRKFVIKEHHFPTNFLYDNTVHNPNSLVSYLNEQNEKHASEEILNVEYDVLRQLLLKLQQKQPSKITFPISLTPFYDYQNVIKFNNENLLPIIHEKFHHTTIDFLVRPYNYLKFASDDGKVRVIHHGKNSNLQFEKIVDCKLEARHEMETRRQCYVVKMTNDLECMLQPTEETAISEPVVDSKPFIRAHRKLYKKLHANNIAKVQVVSKGTVLDDIKQDAIPNIEVSYDEHYYPYERYWLRSMGVTNISKERFDEFFKKFPCSFRLLFCECARIIEQPEKDLFVEYNNVEIYLSYVAKNVASHNKQTNSYFSNNLKKLIQKAKDHW